MSLSASHSVCLLSCRWGIVTQSILGSDLLMSSLNRSNDYNHQKQVQLTNGTPDYFLNNLQGQREEKELPCFIFFVIWV